jgi:hypothetical protein
MSGPASTIHPGRSPSNFLDWPADCGSAELFRVALSTKDFGYLPLFVGMRAGLFAQENLEIQWFVVNSNVVVTGASSRGNRRCRHRWFFHARGGARRAVESEFLSLR